MDMRGLALKKDAVLRTQTADVLKTSEIENEFLDVDRLSNLTPLDFIAGN